MRAAPTVQGSPSRHTATQDLARQLRSWFTDQYRQQETALRGRSHWKSSPWWDGGLVRAADGKTRQRSSIWVKAAELLLEQRAPALPFVRYLFTRSPRKLPGPNHLVSRKLLHAFLSEQEGLLQISRRDLSVAMRTQEDAFRSGMGWYRDAVEMGMMDLTEEEAIETTLLDPELNMSALYRYCVALRYGLAHVQARYYQAALRQYAGMASVYDELWGELIPQDFRAQLTVR